MGAFRFLHRHCLSIPYRAGWNKVWCDRTLHGWYGAHTFQLPLRAVALELEAERMTWDAIRATLTSRQGFKAEEMVFTTDEAATDCLSEFGLTAAEFNSTAARLLLQRLNLDTREEPFVERWRWSVNSGLALLSDGGRIQIRPEIAWARALETVVKKTGGFDTNLISLLRGVNPNETTIELQNNNDSTGWKPVGDKLQFYGLGRQIAGQFLLSTAAGEFPRVAAELWDGS